MNISISAPKKLITPYILHSRNPKVVVPIPNSIKLFTDTDAAALHRVALNAKKNVTKLEQENSQLTQKIAELEQTLALTKQAAQEEKTNFEQIVNESNNMVAIYSDMLKTYSNQIGEKAQQIKSLKVENSHLKNSSTQRQIQELKSINESAKNSIDKLKIENAQLRVAQSTQQELIDEMGTQLYNLNEEVSTKGKRKLSDVNSVTFLIPRVVQMNNKKQKTQ